VRKEEEQGRSARAQQDNKKSKTENDTRLLSVPRRQSCLWGMPVMLTTGSRVHVLVMDYAGHARGGMPVMLAVVCQSRTMPVMLACMPIMLAGACQSRWSMIGMLKACLTLVVIDYAMRMREFVTLTSAPTASRLLV
jgi:hypothetical protein